METEKFSIINSHCKIIQNILIVANSIHLNDELTKSIDSFFSFSCDVATSGVDANAMIALKNYDLVVVDTQSSPQSEVLITEFIKQDLRVIAILNNEDEKYQETILTLSIVDYVVKNDTKTLIDFFINTIQRLNYNTTTVIGICDDSRFSRKMIARLVKLQNLPYIEFQDGQEAYRYAIEQKNPLDVLLTDYEMPQMNGVDLIRKLRQELLANELPIIALSASDKPRITAQLLKAGASDYIQKPFGNEEFFIRLTLTLNQLYASRQNTLLLEKLEKAATCDYLTQLYNRNYFFSQIHHIVAEAIRNNQSYVILMLDIDHFKRVNDTYGHHIGDVAIVHVANTLKKIARTSDYCMRWGGEEFLLLMPNTAREELHAVAQRLRLAIEQSTIHDERLSFNITISIGGAVGIDEEPQSLIAQADALLYEAKNSGRNCVRV